jgi:hypothetical protein
MSEAGSIGPIAGLVCATAQTRNVDLEVAGAYVVLATEDIDGRKGEIMLTPEQAEVLALRLNLAAAESRDSYREAHRAV